MEGKASGNSFALWASTPDSIERYNYGCGALFFCLNPKLHQSPSIKLDKYLDYAILYIWSSPI